MTSNMLTLRDLAERVAGTEAPSDELVGLKAFLVGAAYALLGAEKEGFRHEHPRLAYAAVQDGRTWEEMTPAPWTAGFWFNSGVMRLSGFLDRALKVVTGSPRGTHVPGMFDKAETADQLWRKDYCHLRCAHGLANRLKHEPIGVWSDRDFWLTDATRALREALNMYEVAKGAATGKG